MKKTKTIPVVRTIFATLILFIAATMTSKVSASPARVADDIPWTVINLEMPGSLGFEALYIFDKLSDIEHLRVSGPLNEADWTSLKNMTSIVNLDLSGAQSSEMPKDQFYNRTSLKSILLPGNLTTIGENAFRNTGLVEIEIPSSVTKVNNYCFYESKRLEKVNWKGTANLPHECFYRCENLKSVNLANGITSIGSRSFLYCGMLSEINLPSTLKTIEHHAFCQTFSLKDVIFPDNLETIEYKAFSETGLIKAILPERLQALQYDALSYNGSLEEVVMPATIFKYESDLFRDCKKLTKITIPVATPPSTDNDILANCDKSQIELIVPTFAAVNYKLDTYWLQFGSIKGELESNYWALNSDLALTNDRRMGGTPSIGLLTGAKLTLGGLAPAPFNQILLQNNWHNSIWDDLQFAQVINNCPNASANQLLFATYGHEKRWYFITMPCDVKRANVIHSENAEFVIRYYDGEQRAGNGVGNSWKDVPANAILEAGKAYIFQSNKTGWLVLTADKTAATNFLKSGNRTTAVKAWAGVGDTANPADNGWNLIGNPYASYFDMSATSLSCPITVWNHKNSNYEAYSLIDDDVILYPFQAFFIQQSDVDADITFSADGRQFTSEVSNRFNAPSVKNASRYLINLSLSNASGNTIDKTRVVINEEASIRYEASRDASKFFASDANSAYIYTMDADDNILAINERPADDCAVRLGISVPSQGIWNINAVRSDCKVILYDKETGIDYNLSDEAPYQFATEEGCELNDRFTLFFPNQATGVASIDPSEDLRVITRGDAILIEGASGQNVEIFTLSGVKVYSAGVSSSSESIALPAGFYIVKTAKNSVKCVVR